MTDFVCGIPLDKFKHQPTPEELGAIVARWGSSEQAMFFICMGEGLRNCCGGRAPTQWQYIADDLKATEERLCDGSGSQLIEELACRLVPGAVGASFAFTKNNQRPCGTRCDRRYGPRWIVCRG